MTTRVIGIKEFRQNMTKLWKQGKTQNVRFIVMHHSKPIMDVKPIDEDVLILEQFAGDIEKAMQDVRKGRIYTPKQAKAKLGL